MTLALPNLAEGQSIRITPNVGRPRLILTERTGLVGAREWAEHAFETRAAETFLVELVEADGAATDLGSASLVDVGRWP